MRYQYVTAEGELVDGRGLIRGPYDGLRLIDVQPEGFGVELTVQSSEPECNLNTVVKRWLAGQPMPEFAPMQFGDVTGVRDIADIRSRIAAMGELFMKVPAELRALFHNDPLEFADAVADPRRKGEMVQLGLFPSEDAEAPAAAASAAAAVPKAAAEGDKPA